MEIRIPCKSRKAAEVYIEAAIRAGDTHRMSAVKAENGMWEVVVESKEVLPDLGDEQHVRKETDNV